MDWLGDTHRESLHWQIRDHVQYLKRHQPRGSSLDICPRGFGLRAPARKRMRIAPGRPKGFLGICTLWDWSQRLAWIASMLCKRVQTHWTTDSLVFPLLAILPLLTQLYSRDAASTYGTIAATNNSTTTDCRFQNSCWEYFWCRRYYGTATYPCTVLDS
jgi:hypothetical protein